VFQCSRPGVDCGKKHETMPGLVFFQTDTLPVFAIAKPVLNRQYLKRSTKSASLFLLLSNNAQNKDIYHCAFIAAVLP
jgi:hypothetical protein